MKLIITLVGIILFEFCYSQSDSLKIRKIEIKSYSIDNKFSKKTEKQKIYLDSITLKPIYFKNKIQVISNFHKSKSELKTEFYFENNKIILIRFSELSPFFKNDKAIKFVAYYYDENKKLLSERYYYKLPSTAICSGISREKSFLELYGYNPIFTNGFLHFYTELLLKKLQLNKRIQ